MYLGSSLNILPLSTVESLGIPCEHAVEQSMRYLAFMEIASLTLNYVSINLAVGLSRHLLFSISFMLILLIFATWEKLDS